MLCMPCVLCGASGGGRAQAVELTLGLSEADLAKGEDASFAQLGGDSLAAIQFARSIDELCGVPLPVSFVLDHSNSLAGITAKARPARGSGRPCDGLGQPALAAPGRAGSARLCGHAPTRLARRCSARAAPCARGSLGRVAAHPLHLPFRAMP